MFISNRKPMINSEMSKYIKEQTNKWLQNIHEKYNNSPYIIVSDLVKNTDPKTSNIFIIIPFVSLISFLAGYNFRKSIL